LKKTLKDAEDTWQVLTDFLQLELGIDNASDIEFQRVHRIVPFNQQAPNPRQINARFLLYPNHERVMSNARKFKIKNLEHLQNSLKILLIEEKRCCLSYFLQRRRGKSAYFSRAEPDTQLFIDGTLSSAQTCHLHNAFLSYFSSHFEL